MHANELAELLASHSLFADCETDELSDIILRGHFVRYRWEMFHPQSWLSIYNGYDWHPQAYDPATDGLKRDPMEKRRHQGKQCTRIQIAACLINGQVPRL